MKTIWNIFLIWILLIAGQLSAQEDLNVNLLKINKKIDSIVRLKVQQFEAELQHIDQQLQNKTISSEEAVIKKKRLAKQYAEDLDYTVYKLTGDLKRVSKGAYITDSIINNRTAYKIRKVKLYKKSYYDTCSKTSGNTHAYLFLSVGLNNISDDNKISSIEFSPYGYMQSRFFETGIDWKTNLSRNKTFLVYGFSFVWNTLKPTGNRYHIVNNDTVKIVTHPNDLKKSKLRHIWFKVPLGLEINLPRINKRHLSIAAGIYGKFRLTTKQKLTYSVNGDDHDEVIKNGYTMPGFAYGLTGAIGGTNWIIYADYDLTPVFKNSQKHLIDLGIKWRL